MDEFISREATIKRIKKVYCVGCNSCNGVRCRACGTGDAIDIIEDAPAADVAPVRHGRWLCVDTDTEQFFLCNRCKKKEYWESDYCPSCGAKMDGEP